MKRAIATVAALSFYVLLAAVGTPALAQESAASSAGKAIAADEAKESDATSKESQGDEARAREHYQRFVDFWESGDIDEDRVEHAEDFLDR